jgi:predicted nucleotidyltransferase
VPGFLDTHRHTWQTASRGLGADWSFNQYRLAMHGTLRPHYRPDDIYLGNLARRLEALNSGVTTIGSTPPTAPRTPTPHSPRCATRRAARCSATARAVPPSPTSPPRSVAERTTVVHATGLSDDQLAMMADAGASVSVSPDVELKMGFGAPVIGRVLAAGIRPSLSIDDCPSVGGDMFGTMRTALAADRGLGGSLTTRAVLGFATADGAHTLGLGARTGSIAVGRDADLLLIDAEDPSIFPVSDAIGSIVAAGHPGLVDAVVVAGEVVKRDGRLLGVDLPALRERLLASHDRIAAAAGIPLHGSWVPAPHLTPSSGEPETTSAPWDHAPVRTPQEGLSRLQAAAEAGDLDALATRHGVRVLTVFGSTGRGEPRPRDLDIGVLFEHDHHPDLLALITALDELTGAENDVAHLNRAGPVLRERALVGAVGLFESEPGALADAMVAAVAERIDTDANRRLDLELLAE